MKVGDLVVQGTRVMKMTRGGKPMPPSSMMGMVVAIRRLPEEMLASERHTHWVKALGGSTVDVLWFNGRLVKNFAMNGLEVVSAQKD